MDFRALKDRLGRIVTLGAAVGGVGGLLLLAISLENSDAFSRQLLAILIGMAIAVLALGWLLARKLIQLRRDYREHVPGSRLTVRTVAVFGTLVVVPLLVVYLFTLEYLNRGIDSWFDVDIQQGLRQALVLTGDAQRLRNRGLVDSTEALARQLGFLPVEEWPQRLEHERRAMDVNSIAVYEFGGRVLASSNSDLLPQLASPPPPAAATTSPRNRPTLAIAPCSPQRPSPRCRWCAAHRQRAASCWCAIRCLRRWLIRPWRCRTHTRNTATSPTSDSRSNSVLRWR
jgi:nitrogen fixation/metabolism regulation signal transduction histidine kinase